MATKLRTNIVLPVKHQILIERIATRLGGTSVSAAIRYAIERVAADFGFLAPEVEKTTTTKKQA